MTADQKAAIKALRALRTGRNGDALREHAPGMTITYTTSYRDTVTKIERAVRALGGVVYAKTSAVRKLDGRRYTTIEWTVSPTADDYVLRGPGSTPLRAIRLTESRTDTPSASSAGADR